MAPPTKVRWGESTEPPNGGGEGTEPPAEGGEGTDTHEGALRALEAARAAAAAAQHAEQGSDASRLNIVILRAIRSLVVPKAINTDSAGSWTHRASSFSGRRAQRILASGYCLRRG